jgi:hypothetical protein
VRSWDRRFEQVKKRYRDFAGITLRKLPSWDQVLHAQELRNALVHNQGHYTRAFYRRTARPPIYRALSAAGLTQEVQSMPSIPPTGQN